MLHINLVIYYVKLDLFCAIWHYERMSTAGPTLSSQSFLWAWFLFSFSRKLLHCMVSSLASFCLLELVNLGQTKIRLVPCSMRSFMLVLNFCDHTVICLTRFDVKSLFLIMCYVLLRWPRDFAGNNSVILLQEQLWTTRICMIIQ